MDSVTKPRAAQHVLWSAIRNQPADRTARNPPQTVKRLDRLKPRNKSIQRRTRHPKGLPTIAASDSQTVPADSAQARFSLVAFPATSSWLPLWALDDEKQMPHSMRSRCESMHRLRETLTGEERDALS